ncbi:MAG: hypothetical protein IJF49_08095 [Clostridia bacterium]|nr:hypothetical protein [Clostridia bacterium]
MKNNLSAAAAAITVNTPVTTADLCTAPVPAFRLPSCCFAAATCRDCDHYSGSWCYKHKTWTDPDKWPCSYFQ